MQVANEFAVCEIASDSLDTGCYEWLYFSSNKTRSIYVLAIGFITSPYIFNKNIWLLVSQYSNLPSTTPISGQVTR
jgi:hypothetical protein